GGGHLRRRRDGRSDRPARPVHPRDRAAGGDGRRPRPARRPRRAQRASHGGADAVDRPLHRHGSAGDRRGPPRCRLRPRPQPDSGAGPPPRGGCDLGGPGAGANGWDRGRRGAPRLLVRVHGPRRSFALVPARRLEVGRRSARRTEGPPRDGQLDPGPGLAPVLPLDPLLPCQAFGRIALLPTPTRFPSQRRGAAPPVPRRLIGPGFTQVGYESVGPLRIRRYALPVPDVALLRLAKVDDASLNFGSNTVLLDGIGPG